MIPGISPLEMFFREIVGKHLREELGIRSAAVAAYVAHLLVDYCESAGIREENTRRKPHWFDQVKRHRITFDRERQERLFVGDFILFVAGMAPERLPFSKRLGRLGNFVEFMKAGKESYYIVSKFEHFEYAEDARIFSQLSEHFEVIVYALNMTKDELEGMQRAVSHYFVGPCLKNRVDWLAQQYEQIWLARFDGKTAGARSQKTNR